MEVKVLAMLLGSVLLAGVVLTGARPAYAENYTCAATLDGSQEVPPVETDGAGTASLTFDSATNTLAWEIEFSGLSGPATAAHFHGPAVNGTNAGILVDIGGASDVSSPLTGSIVVGSNSATYLLAGQMYINIHTSANPSGEIRGQIACEAVGEMKTAALTYGEEEHEIQYSITNGTLTELTGDADNKMITAQISAAHDGELKIQLPRELIDSAAGEQDLDYIVFVDEMEVYAEDDFGADVRTLTIPFTEGSALVDIVSASPPAAEPGLPATTHTVSVAGANIDIAVRSSSTITAFSLDEGSKTVSFAVAGEEGTPGVTEITIGRVLEGPYTVMVDGDVTTDFEVDESSGESVIRLTYVHGIGEVTITGANVVPEFPLAAVALAAAIVGVVAVTARYGKFSFLPK
ncbi:CHRD domain-containing protein [Nitrososphaera sp.]|uniref:CHRD domain-containing protein n=1 Tax=Nitrososphaera sp. TaxID=1971748 RepID=UPI00180DF10E|nr:CHRD domain-containing protein [Nitrososphaera sp.]NWG36896.1 CHRD domain-containing protein [Nitrososphaera sp.]